MAYIDKNLLPDEEIKFRTRKHIVIFLWPFVWLIICIMATIYFLENPILSKLTFLPWIAAIIWWASVLLSYFTAEFAVTNKRVMMREGLFNRHANETRLNAISQVYIDQNLLGQLLGYGTVSINTYGVFDTFTLLSKPHAFQQHVNTGLDKVVRGG